MRIRHGIWRPRGHLVQPSRLGPWIVHGRRLDRGGLVMAGRLRLGVGRSGARRVGRPAGRRVVPRTLDKRWACESERRQRLCFGPYRRLGRGPCQRLGRGCGTWRSRGWRVRRQAARVVRSRRALHRLTSPDRVYRVGSNNLRLFRSRDITRVLPGSAMIHRRRTHHGRRAYDGSDRRGHDRRRRLVRVHGAGSPRWRCCMVRCRVRPIRPIPPRGLCRWCREGVDRPPMVDAGLDGCLRGRPTPLRHLSRRRLTRHRVRRVAVRAIVLCLRHTLCRRWRRSVVSPGAALTTTAGRWGVAHAPALGRPRNCSFLRGPDQVLIGRRRRGRGQRDTRVFGDARAPHRLVGPRLAGMRDLARGRGHKPWFARTTVHGYGVDARHGRTGTRRGGDRSGNWSSGRAPGLLRLTNRRARRIHVGQGSREGRRGLVRRAGLGGQRVGRSGRHGVTALLATVPSHG